MNKEAFKSACMHACFSNAPNSEDCILPKPSDLCACGVISVLLDFCLDGSGERKVRFPQEENFTEGVFLHALVLP